MVTNSHVDFWSMRPAQQGHGAIWPPIRPITKLWPLPLKSPASARMVIWRSKFSPPRGRWRFLPLVDAHRLALIWSLPERRGHALAAADAAIFNHELSRATEDFFGPLEVIGKPAKQPLLLYLAHDFVAPGRVLIGDAAHIIHPLAGQGFNLTLRDIAELADCLHHGRHLGLASDDFSILEAYQTHRRSDAGLTVAATDGLNRIFSTRHSLLTGLASLGLGVSDGLARRFPQMRRAFAAQADYGTSPPARLMRGENFTD